MFFWGFLTSGRRLVGQSVSSEVADIAEKPTKILYKVLFFNLTKQQMMLETIALI